jgi:hypothetical protein
MDSCDIVIAGERTRIRSNSEPFIRYARSHFAPVLAEEAGECEVEISYLHGEAGGSPDFRGQYDKVCRGVYVGERIVWNDVPFLPGLRMAFRVDDRRMGVEAAYAPPRSALRSLKRAALFLSGRAVPRERFFFEIMYNLVYYPIFWRLRRRGIFPMHGAGVVTRGLAIVVAGAQGTGKSTLVAQLLAGSADGFISDNILLYDGGRVYPCHEPLRIDAGMLARMPHLEAILDPVDVPVPLGRRAFNVARRAYRDSASPDVVLVPRMSRAATGLRPIARETVMDRVREFNTLADEIRSFEVFASVLGAAMGAAGVRAEETRALETLFSRARCFELTIRYGEHPAETAAALEAALGADGGAKQ